MFCKVAGPPGKVRGALETERQAGMKQFEQEVVRAGILLGAIEFFEETVSASILAKETRLQAVSRRRAILFRKIGQNLVGGGAQHVFGGVSLLGRDASGVYPPIACFDRRADLRRQPNARRADQRGAQTAEQKQ